MADTMKVMKITLASGADQKKRLAMFAKANIATHNGTQDGCFTRSLKNRNGLRIA
jgi:hypothetical protein